MTQVTLQLNDGDTRTAVLKLWEAGTKKRVYINNPLGKSKFASDMGYVENGEYIHGRNHENIRGVTKESFNDMVKVAIGMMAVSVTVAAEHHPSVGRVTGRIDYDC